MNSALTVVFYGLCLCAATKAQTYPDVICGSGELENTECIDIRECEPIIRRFEESKKSHTRMEQAAFYDEVHKLKCDSGISKALQKVCCPIKRSKSATCGKIPQDEMLIDGGKADPLGHEWSALLEYDTPRGIEVGCGGVLISDRHVLTAASCVESKNRLTSVRLGQYELLTEVDTYFPKYESISIAEKKAHENYSILWNEFKEYDDIAIVTLARSVATQPICLPSHDFNPDDTFYAVGWGISGDGKEPRFQSKSQVRMKKTECGIFEEKTICAKQQSGNDSYSCVSDEGGPLLQREDVGNKPYVVAGIAYFTDYPCKLDPKRYTNVFKYKDWIIKNMH